jgi:NAD-dependent deacetylase
MAPNNLAEARAILCAASRLAVLTGAGISAESGIPTFRGPGGLWRNHRAEDLATPQAFSHDPKMVWEWYDWRRGLIAQAEPNAAHRALVKLEQAKESFALVTQNVDGLHDRAGSKAILKVHGDIWTLRCLSCRQERVDRTTPLAKLPPHCACGGIERPGVVWFGEGLPENVWQESVEAARRCDVFLIVGTSAVVYPAAGLAEIARSAGAKVIEVNVTESAISNMVDHCLLGPAAEILPELVS